MGAGGRVGWTVAVGLLASLTGTACGTRVDREAYFARLQAGGAPAAEFDDAAVGPEAVEGMPGGTDERSAQNDSGLADGRTYSVGSRPTSGPGAAGVRPGAKVTTTTARRADGAGAARATAASPPSTADRRLAPAAAAAADRSGLSADVVGDVIRIGLHLPETGAAPLPTDWKEALAVMEEHVNAQPVHGRRIQFVTEDDGYDASRGLAACRKLADENVLFVIGHTAPAAEHACTDLYQSRRIPYLMRGVMEKVIAGRPLAWFGTIPDDVQGRLLADYALRLLGAQTRKAAVVYENDQITARDTFVARIRAGGGTIAATEEVNGRQSDFSAVVQKLQQSGAELVFLSLPPVAAIKIAVQAQGQGYHPTWLGGASYWNYNMALEAAGAALDGAISFSPWPAVDSSDAAAYRAAYQKSRPGKEPTDIGLVLWGWGNLARAALERAGPQLSRATFVDALQDFEFRQPYWNPVRYTPGDHRGTASVAVFRADGQARRWRQITGFTERF